MPSDGKSSHCLWQGDLIIYDLSLTLSTCNVLVIYKVLALACAWSK